MMLSEQEAEEIKQKIISYIEENFELDQIANARQQIEAMNSDELERFAEKNKILKQDNPDENPGCVFCAIASGKIKSVKLDEDEKAVAVLDINPISKGHSLIIPKEHEANEKEAMTLAKKVSKLIKKKLKPKEVKISNSKLSGHVTISVLPVYSNEDFNSERKKVTLEDLEKVKEEIEKELVKKIRKPRIKKIKEFLWLPKRIP
jgi:histidine triad (HIT) family protein